MKINNQGGYQLAVEELILATSDFEENKKLREPPRIVIFSTESEARTYRKENAARLKKLMGEVEKIEFVEYSDLWLNANCPSFVAGFNSEDEMIVCIPLTRITVV